MLTISSIINIALLYLTKDSTRIPIILMAATSLILVALPAYGLLFGEQATLLEKIGFNGSSDELYITRALSLIGISIVSYILGALLRRRKITNLKSDPSFFSILEREKFKLIWKLLSIIGLFGALIAIVMNFSIETRASQGQGIPVLMLHGWMIAPAIAIIFHHWGEKSSVAITFLQVILILQIGGARSSLTLVFLSVFIRLTQKNANQDKNSNIKLITVASIGLYIGLIFVQAIPILRAELRTHTLSLTTYVEIFRDPITNLTSVSGFDSVEGAILAIYAKDHGFDVSPTDPFKAISTFIPRQIWPNKPQFTGPELTKNYSQVRGNAGIVISGGAYLYLIGGSSLLVVAIFYVLGIWTVHLSQNFRTILPFLFILHFTMRFTYGGDAFDLFYILQDVLLFLIASKIVNYLWKQKND